MQYVCCPSSRLRSHSAHSRTTNRFNIFHPSNVQCCDPLAAEIIGLYAGFRRCTYHNRFEGRKNLTHLGKTDIASGYMPNLLESHSCASVAERSNAPDCRSGGFILRWFESNPAHKSSKTRCQWGISFCGCPIGSTFVTLGLKQWSPDYRAP